MAKITAIIGEEKYRTLVTSSTNQIVTDEPVDKGGTDLGFSPGELLSASLASCTSITLRMYSDRNEWNVRKIKVEVEFWRDSAGNKTEIHRHILIEGDLEESQRKRMLAIANACPMHKLLMSQINIESKILEL
jgi:putative redox protein